MFFNSIYSQSQTDSLLIRWEEFIEDESDFAEILEELAENPININSKNQIELLRIPFITTNQVDSILNKRNRDGHFKSKRQIRSILGTELYGLVKDFITIKHKSKHSLTYTHKSYYGLEPINQIKNGSYRGDALYDYNKVQFNWANNVRIGMNTQKDIGEANYLDYVNGYIEYKTGKMKGIIGSYYCHFGEGLVFSNAFGQQKSSIASLPFRPSKKGGFSTLSSSENTSMFGIFFNFDQIYNSNLYLFYSNTNRDAQFSRDWNSITAIDYDGYHRTNSEIRKKDVISESVFGIACSYSILRVFNIGLNYSIIKYNPSLNYEQDIVGEDTYRREKFNFSGSQINQFSAFYDFTLNSVQFRGEFAGSQQGGSAYTQSVFLDENLFRFGGKFWRLSKCFQSPFGRVFDDSNPFPQAEEGFYVGLSIDPYKNISINLFKIIKKDLWRTYFDELPKMNDELFFELNYQPNTISLLARMRIKDNEHFNESWDENSITRNIERQKIYRIQIDYKPVKQFLFRTRWESTDVENEKGSYLFEDIHFSPQSSLSVRTRILFYRTDSYSSRLYEYESDLPGSYANYAVFGEGRVFYLLLKWKIHERISIWFKYRYNNIIKRDLTPAIIRVDDKMLQRTIRFQIKLQL